MGRLVNVFKKNDELSYSYYLPEKKSEDEKLPLMVFLHGAGERGNDLKGPREVGMVRHFFNGKMERTILLIPQCPEGFTWAALIKDLKKLIDNMVKEFNVDESRITMTGISMGGQGTYDFAMTYPTLLAGIGVVCGIGSTWRSDTIKDLPIRIYHGDADPVVDVKNAFDMYDSLKKNGGNPHLTIFHGVEHNSWDMAYGETNLIKWLYNLKKGNK